MSLFNVRFEPASDYENSLWRAAAETGIDHEYWDIFHKRHETSAETRRKILEARGWDVSTFESLEAHRRQRFEQWFTVPVPSTVVLAEAEKWVPLTLAEEQGSLCFEIELEDREALAGSIELSQLQRVRTVEQGECRWWTRRLDLPSELPVGYHSLRLSLNGLEIADSLVIVCPERAYLPEQLANGGRTAGFNVSLYGLRSQRNWGCGDFTDLEGLMDWAHSDVGFSFIGLNPLHALHNRVPYNTSPYLPLSMYYKNLIYIDIERVPEFQHSRAARCLFRSEKQQQKMRSLRDAEFVQYTEIDRVKRRFLKLLYREFRRRRAAVPERALAFQNYCRDEGDLLEGFALYCALDEVLHKQDRNRWTWRDWPGPYQSRNSEECQRFSQQHPRLLEFYKYVQFVIDEQLAAAQEYAAGQGMKIGLYHDLAVATDSFGSDLWAHQKFYVNGCRVGAPPDDFSPNGQDWGFPPPNTDAHREDGYRLYRESIRKIVKHGGALRLDHVMRLFRLFWIPAGLAAPQGTYVRDFATDLMRVLALESVRSKNVIIGEDLGTVTDEIRDALARFGILSYRLFYFEKYPRGGGFKPSSEYPLQALVSSTTHDLPTLAGFWTFRDIEARKAAGLVDEAGYWNQINDRKREKQGMLDTLHAEHLLPTGYPGDADQIPGLDGPLHNAVIGFLAQVPSMILLLNQEDFTTETEQQNLPGSTAQYPNWQRKMKVGIEELRLAANQGYTAMFRDQLEKTGRRD
ncbi:MAG: 4-alpha-glucanotransferase [Acidobacteriaceae bacterium]|nr:4-alpha-glucanotransferase [Acidobacteriaceae bacterium]